MGNRAVITTKAEEVGVYLHWNGGIESVQAFCSVCEALGFEKPEHDNYGWARLVQVISNFFGGGEFVGVDSFERLNTYNRDNGYYVIENWKVIKQCDNNQTHTSFPNFDEQAYQSVFNKCLDIMNKIGYDTSNIKRLTYSENYVL